MAASLTIVGWLKSNDLFLSQRLLKLPLMVYALLGARCSSVVRAFAHGAMGRRMILHGVDPLSYFSFQSVLHNWCNKGRGMCYYVCGMVYIKEPLLVIGKSSLCGGSGFPLSHMSDAIQP